MKWLFFIFLLLIHTLAALPSIPLSIRQWTWLSGVTLALIAMNFWKGRERTRSPKQVLLAIPGFYWILLIGLSICLRCLHFTGAATWPNFDESELALSALQLGRDWRLKPFYSVGQIPPLFNFLEALWFKLSAGSFWNIWALPALISVTTLALAGWAMRRTLPSHLVFIGLAFLGTGYWPVFAQSFNVQAVLVPLWEWGAILLMIFFHEAAAPRARRGWILLLGLWTGSGFWAYKAWAVAAVAIVLFICFYPFPPRRSRITGLEKGLFASAFLVPFLPFLVICYREGYGTYLFNHSLFRNDWFSWRDRLSAATDYFQCLFWGYQSAKTLYVPSWGGLLNPFWASLSILGSWEFLRSKRDPEKRWFLFGLVLLLVPGILSHNLQVLRISLLIPLLAFPAFLGFQRLFLALKGQKARVAFLLLGLLIPALWDGWRLQESYRVDEAPTAGYRAAFTSLKSLDRDWGPGLVFTEFGTPSQDIQGLEVMAYPFDGLQHKTLSPQPKWAALITDLHFQPCLENKFPQARWACLPGEDLMIGIFPPPSPSSSVQWDEWVQMDGFSRKRTLEIDDINNDRTHEIALEGMRSIDPGLIKDDFLRACYWKKLADFYYDYGFERNYDLQVEALRQATLTGCPAPHLDYELGCLLMRKSRFTEARLALQRALVSPFDKTQVQEAFRILDRLENQGR